MNDNTNTAATSGDAPDLQQLKALALAFQNENGEHWYNYLQLADGISYESAADFMVKVSPAVVLGLIARIESNEVESYRRGYVEGMEEGARLAVEPATASGDERADFETWIKSRLGYPFAGTFTNLMWDAWQARAAVSAATKPTADQVRNQALDEAAELVSDCDKRATLKGIACAIRALKSSATQTTEGANNG